MVPEIIYVCLSEHVCLRTGEVFCVLTLTKLFLASKIESAVVPEGKIIVTTKGKGVKSTNTLIFSHAHKKKLTIILCCTVLTLIRYEEDKVACNGHRCTSTCHCYSQCIERMWDMASIWSQQGTLQSTQLQLSLEMISAIKGLLFVHVFLGCDTVSLFCGIEKKTVFDVWESLSSLVTLLSCLSETPKVITHDCMEDIEKFVVLLYSHTSQLLIVNAAWKQLLS